MSGSERLRSWIALPVVAVLLGAPALPLALCAFDSGQARCAADMPRRAESLHGCHEAETPAPAAMTCCCDSDAGAVPFTTSTLAAVAGAPLAIAVSPVNPVMPGGAAGAGKPNTTLLTRHLPLFTLFSAFLI